MILGNFEVLFFGCDAEWILEVGLLVDGLQGLAISFVSCLLL